MKKFKFEKGKELHVTKPPRLKGEVKNVRMNPIKKPKQTEAHKKIKKLSRDTSMKKTRKR